MRRVVVTGMSGVTALGHSWPEIQDKMQKGVTGIRHMPEWADIQGLNTQLAAPIQLDLEGLWPRKATRSMGPVALYALYATEKALSCAGLQGDPVLRSGRVGVAYGSSFGSPSAMPEFAELLIHRSLKKLTATSYIRMMGHTAAVNIGLYYGLQGRIIPTSTACTSGSMAIGYGVEAIRYGLQDVVIAGGTEELCPSMASVFDTLYATSTRNGEPQLTPRPFDKDRDGLVIGEGATTLILEEYEHAVARGATIYAEVIGFATNTDGNHATQPTQETMKKAMWMALIDAKLTPQDIGFISGHGTATEFGDIAEAAATHALFGNRVPFHSMKSYFGHTLGACGALEAWLMIEMMHSGWFAPTANLETVDPRCADLDYIMHQGRTFHTPYAMSNNFAFGGINTSLIFKHEGA